MIDKTALLKPRLPEDDVEVPGVGTVRVRGLNRLEALEVQQVEGIAAKDAKIIAFGLVDPPLTEEEAAEWQRAAPAEELEPVTQRIAELSALTDGAYKAAVKTFHDDSGDGVRVLPGSGAGADSEPAQDRAEQ